MHQYVLFVSALAPDVFLFENVRHFQAKVKSGGVEFDAADILAESINAVSDRGLGYSVASKIVVASEHAVPQTRERFVMVGIRRPDNGPGNAPQMARWCLLLPQREPVALNAALEGLPEPSYAGSRDTTSPLSPVRRSPHADGEIDVGVDLYRSWVFRSATVDSHVARPPRPDDQAFFALIGPGKRWMDFRCDDAPTLKRLAALARILQKTTKTQKKQLGISEDDLSWLSEVTDGSLSLRLLLESIPPEPGETQHHLITPTYLRKKEGAHGDWLARMNASQPSKTIVSHMAKDTYAYIHPFQARTISVREAARIQSFPDDYHFSSVGLVDAFRVVGNAVPPLLSLQFAERVASILAVRYSTDGAKPIIARDLTSAIGA